MQRCALRCIVNVVCGFLFCAPAQNEHHMCSGARFCVLVYEYEKHRSALCVHRAMEQCTIDVVGVAHGDGEVGTRAANNPWTNKSMSSAAAAAASSGVVGNMLGALRSRNAPTHNSTHTDSQIHYTHANGKRPIERAKDARESMRFSCTRFRFRYASTPIHLYVYINITYRTYIPYASVHEKKPRRNVVKTHYLLLLLRWMQLTCRQLVR